VAYATGIVQIEFLVPLSRLPIWTGNLRDSNHSFVEGRGHVKKTASYLAQSTHLGRVHDRPRRSMELKYAEPLQCLLVVTIPAAP
jgi:hypothetical protein